jgi:hypothetical protein
MSVVESNQAVEAKTPEPKRPKVLFIAGNGRSGSTILDVVLGQLDDFFAVGELRRIWDRGLIENRPCGCGKPFRQCATWGAILEEAFGSAEDVAPKLIASHRDMLTQTKHLPAMLLGTPSPLRKREIKSFVAILDKLYRAIQTVTGARVIVDSSKWPMYAYMLDQTKCVDLHILHLVRDPRAVAFSWGRERIFEGERTLPTQGALKSTFYWASWNPAIRYLWNRSGSSYHFLKYESFIEQPEESLSEIIGFVGEAVSTTPFVGPSQVKLERTHAVAGNIARLTAGPVDLRLDDEWKSKLSTPKKTLVTCLTWPLLKAYGYDFSA